MDNIEFRAQAYFTGVPEQPNFIELTAVVPTTDDAKQVAAQFPKSLRVGSTRLTTPEWTPGEHRSYGYVRLQVFLTANDANGGINEGGIKRYQSFMRHVGRLGYTVRWNPDGRAGYPTQEAFEAAITR
jgi:hypothetical protein